MERDRDGNASSDEAQHKCEETKQLVRFNPLHVRTLLDENLYKVTINAEQDWFDSVDASLGRDGGENKPLLSLSHPPRHHLYLSKDSVDYLFHNATLAELYALDQKGATNIVVLDFDVHHGFDELVSDWPSRLMMKPEKYTSLARNVAQRRH
eukprot:13549320-Ditylum_brightwellii.AAC.1